VLLIGITPPACEYWSITPYLYSRETAADFAPRPINFRHKLASCLPGKNRCEIFAGINDPLNLKTVIVGDNDANNNTSRDNFELPFAVLMVFDAETEARAKTSMTRARPMQPGGSYFNSNTKQAAINVLRFPGSVLNLGISDQGSEDDFSMVMRVEGIADKTKDFFVKSKYMRAYRLTYKQVGGMPVPASSFFPSFEPELRVRTTGRMEGDGFGSKVSHTSLLRAFDELQLLVQNDQNLAGSKILTRTRMGFYSFVQNSGYECLREGIKCQGDCRDTIYAVATLEVRSELCDRLHLPCPQEWSARMGAEDSYVVVGIQHAKLNHAIYASITMYNYPKLASISGLTDRDISQGGFDGSAERLFPSGHASLAPYLYAVMFSRNCKDKKSKILCVDISGADRKLEANSTLLFVERMYLNPATLSGPAVNETILPVMFHVSHGKLGSVDEPVS